MASFFQKNKRIILAVILVGLIAAPLALVPVHKAEAAWWDYIGPLGGFTWTKFLLTGKLPGGEGTGVSCITSISAFGECIGGAIAVFMDGVILPLASGVLSITGVLLDGSIRAALDTGWFKSITAIDAGWMIIRDLVNMGFIFIMLYIAISTILQLSSYNIKSMLVKLIIAAVFINFSLFITRVVMDAGNIVALNFYNAITNNQQTTSSKQIITLSKLESAYGVTGQDTDPKINYLTGIEVVKELSGSALLANQILRLFVMCVAIYVFFKASFLFIARILGFIFLMLFSPIGFIGAVFPGASGAATKWRKTLIDQTLVAPVFIILIYSHYFHH